MTLSRLIAALAVPFGVTTGVAEPFTVERFDYESAVIDEPVAMSALLPPGRHARVPLTIWLHGGGGDREQLPQYRHWLGNLLADGAIGPTVVVSFSTSPVSGFLGAWEKLIEELPGAMAERYRTDASRTVIAGISMGGYGALKSAFRSPQRYVAVGAMEPSVEPTLTALPNYTRNTWHRGPADALGPADNPARQAHDNAEAIRRSGLEIYLEVGDEDYLNLHDGTEFVHRVLWDHDIRHEYHLVRWADHIGPSMRGRFEEMFRFLAQALAGGRQDPVALPITAGEQELLNEVAELGAQGKPPPDAFTEALNGPRGPTLHAHFWSSLKAQIDGPDASRAYGKLPSTTLEEDVRAEN